MDENLKQLEEIGKEIDNIENKLQSISEKVPDHTYNRKQRRQIQRKMIRDEKIKQHKIEQKGNTFVTRKEFVGLFQSAQKLRDRLFYIDILTSALEKLLIDKKLVTADEIKHFVDEETDRAKSFHEIQNGQKDYDARLKKCLELQIDPNLTIIGRQIYEDTELALADKIKLAEEYNLQILLNILKKQMENQSNVDVGKLS